MSTRPAGGSPPRAPEVTGPEAEGLRERKKRLMRQQLSDTATQMFLDRGFDAVRVTEIAEACGVSEKTVFNYFPTKESLILDRLESTVASLRTGLAEPGISPVDAALRILDGELGAMTSWLAQQADPAQAGAMIQRFGALIQATPSLRAYQSDMMDRYVAVAAAILAERAAMSADDPEPQIAASALLGLWRIHYRSLSKYLGGTRTPAQVHQAVTADVHRAARLIDTGLASLTDCTSGLNGRRDNPPPGGFTGATGLPEVPGYRSCYLGHLDDRSWAGLARALVADRDLAAGDIGLRRVRDHLRLPGGDPPGGPRHGRRVQHVDCDPPQGFIRRDHQAHRREQAPPPGLPRRGVLRVVQWRARDRAERKLRMHLIQRVAAAQPVVGGFEQLAAQPPGLDAEPVPGQLAAHLIRVRVSGRQPDRRRRDRENGAPARAEQGPRPPVRRAPAGVQQAQRHVDADDVLLGGPPEQVTQRGRHPYRDEAVVVTVGSDPARAASVHAGYRAAPHGCLPSRSGHVCQRAAARSPRAKQGRISAGPGA